VTHTRERWLLLAILGGGLLIRLPFAAIDPRVSGDLNFLVGWAGAMARGGLAELMATSQLIFYPPLSMLWIWLGGVVGSPVVVIKLSAIVADVALAGLIWLMLRERGPKVALAGAAAICFNPAFWYLSAIWGQIDSVYVLLMVASVALLAAHRVGSSWAAWMLGVAWKLQALVIGPLLLAATLRVRGWRGLLVGAAGSAAVALASFAAFRLLLGGGLIGYAGRLWHDDDELVISAYSAWYPIRLVASRLSDAVLDLLTSGFAWALGWAAVAVVAIAVMHATWRRPSRDVLALGAAVLALAPFVLLIGMRERYLLAAIPFLALAAAGWGGLRVDRAALLAFVLISVSQLVNLIAVASFLPSLWLNTFATDQGVLALPIRYAGYGFALVNLAVLGWGVVRLYRLGQSGPAELEQAADESLLAKRDAPNTG
jgi:Gpi18-like mannosyltransferase